MEIRRPLPWKGLRQDVGAWQACKAAYHSLKLPPPEAGGPRKGRPWAELRGSLWAWWAELRPRVAPGTCWMARPTLGIISHHDRCGGSGVLLASADLGTPGLKPKPHAVRSPRH